MPLFLKPQFNSVWASTGAKLTPEVAKINQGWVVEIPPHEFDNWMQNRQDALLAHLNQLGIPQWDNTVEYQAGKSYVQGSTSGIVFRANTTNTNINPELDIQGNWTIAFQAQGEALLKSQNLADVPDKALARTNLGIATTEFYDNRYLIKNSNLIDIPNKASARNNLDVYSKSEVFNRAEVELLFQPAEIKYFATQSPPPGFLVANGQAVSRTTYARLFSAIGTFFGEGNGTTTFNVPDIRGEFLRGWDNGRGIDPGRAFGSLQTDAIRNIVGQITADPNTAFQFFGEGNMSQSGALRVTQRTGLSFADGGSLTSAGASLSFDASAVVPTASENRPRNRAFLPCISTGLLS